MLLKHQKAKNLKEFTEDQQRELLTYHNKGMNYKEVALKMGMQAKRVKDKAHKMGVSLNSIKGKAK